MLPVIVCFGTRKVSGDSLAPEIGSILKNRYNLKVFVYGDLDSPIDATRAKDAIEHIKKTHPDSPIVAIDACVGRSEDIGKIRIKKNGVRPAEALKRNMGSFGDVGILGIVAKTNNNPLFELMSVPSLIVSQLADKISVALHYAIKAVF